MPYEPMSDEKFEAMSRTFNEKRYPRLDLEGILTAIGVAPGKTVLDFGCGPGNFSIAAATLVTPGGLVYALDIVPLAAKKIAAAAARKGLDNLRAITSGGPTGLDDDAVDVVLLFDILHHLEPPEPVLTELARVLAADGVLAVEDHHLEDEDLVARVEGGGPFTLSGRTDYAHLFSLVR